MVKNPPFSHHFLESEASPYSSSLLIIHSFFNSSIPGIFMEMVRSTITLNPSRQTTSRTRIIIIHPIVYILILLNQKFLIPYISIYVEERKKGYTTCLGRIRVFLGHKQEGWRNKKEREIFS